MYKNKYIAVVIPAYNEERKIKNTLRSVPDYIDQIFVVNDQSTDGTKEKIFESITEDSRISYFELDVNSGVGASIVKGYQEVIKSNCDVAVVMAGDGQMDPCDLPSLLNPVIEGKCDYAKGNRLLHGDGIDHIPKRRLIGNLILSICTKIASGYWHVSDSQGGYTAIGRRALEEIKWEDCYPRYGCPNDYLVKLNIANMKVADVPVKAIYGSEWSSSLKIKSVIFPIATLLCRLFLHRLYRKYVVMNGHPIVFTYLMFFASSFFLLLLSLYILSITIGTGVVPQTALILFVMFLILSVQMLFHAFDMDYRQNEHLFVFLENTEQ